MCAPPHWQNRAKARLCPTAAVTLLCVALAPAPALAASLPDAPCPQPTQTTESAASTLKGLPLAIARDQAPIWTSPLRIRTRDLRWLLPLAGAASASLATDRRTSTEVVSHDPAFNQANTNASNVLIGGFAALPAGLYGWGLSRHDEHARQTGLLGAEALADGLIVEQGTKLIFFRERPVQNFSPGDSSRGRFFQTSAGINSSFPSSHSTLAWASAAVVAQQYPSLWTQLSVYSLATGVSLTRVLGQQHFPTDVLLGAAAGWLIGHSIASKHPWPKTLSTHPTKP